MILKHSLALLHSLFLNFASHANETLIIKTQLSA